MNGTTVWRLKGVRVPPDPGDGVRVFVDRLWPRGLAKAQASWDRWDKDVAPSTELRRWYGHDPERFEEFSSRYRAELDASGAARLLAEAMVDVPVVTLLVGAHDMEHSQGAVLVELLNGA